MCFDLQCLFTLNRKYKTENGVTFPSSLRHVFCIRGRGLAAQEGRPQCHAGPEPAEPRLLDQPLRPKLVHVLVRLLHPLPWRAQDPAAAAARCLPAGRRSGPHAHRYRGRMTSWTAAVAPRASQRHNFFLCVCLLCRKQRPSGRDHHHHPPGQRLQGGPAPGR